MPAKIFGSLDTWTKRAVAITATTYCIGYVIESWHLYNLQITDASFLRPQLILVGLCFLLYILIPAAPIVVSALIFIRLDCLSSFRKRLAVSMLVGITVTIFIPLPFHYFITTTNWNAQPIRWVYGFWHAILCYRFLPVALLLYASILAFTCYFLKQFEKHTTGVHLSAIGILAGTLFSMSAYVHGARYHIAHGLGGASLKIVTIYGYDLYRPFLSIQMLNENKTLGNKYDDEAPEFQTFILLHEDDDYVYVRIIELESGKETENSTTVDDNIVRISPNYSVVAIPRERILGIRYEKLVFKLVPEGDSNYDLRLFDANGVEVPIDRN